MTVLMLSIVVALFIKVYAQYCIIKGKIVVPDKLRQVITLYIIIACSLSVLELVSITSTGIFEGPAITGLIKLYHALAVSSFLLMLVIVRVISKSGSLKIEFIRFAIFLPIYYFILNGSHIISGHSTISYSVTRVPGDYYWVFQISVLLIILESLWISIHGGQSSDFAASQQRSRLVLAVSLVLVSVVIVLLAGYLSLPVNATGVGALMSGVVAYVLTLSANQKTVSECIWRKSWTFTSGDLKSDKNASSEATVEECKPDYEKQSVAVDQDLNKWSFLYTKSSSQRNSEGVIVDLRSKKKYYINTNE